MLTAVGETAIEVAVGAFTVTVAEAVFVLSAALVAVTVIFVAAAGAVSRPLALIEPAEADQVTDLFATEPCTVAENCWVAPVRMEEAAGDTETDVTAGAPTVTVADTDLVESATLVAVIVAVTAFAAAVKRPAALIVPDEVFHVTDLLVELPCTVAVSCSVAPASIEAVDGAIDIEVTPGAEGGAAVTFTVVDADFVGSATLVAVMTAEPAFAGAVNTPATEIVPFEVVQVTPVLVAVPCTAAENVREALAATLADEGEILTALTPDAGGLDGGGFVVGATAVAVRGTTVGVSLALVTSARLPFMVPGVSGVNATANVFATPGPSVAGSSRPEELKPLPVTVT
jgi:hypothetical protein